MASANTKQNVLVTSYLRVLTDRGFLGGIAKATGSPLAEIRSGAGDSPVIWRAGDPTKFADAEFRDVMLVFEQPIALRNFVVPILNSQFKYSLKLFRRPGNPKGISPQAAVAADEAAPAIMGQQFNPGPYSIDDSAYMGPSEPYQYSAIQYDEGRGIFFADFKEVDKGTRYWRMEGTDEVELEGRVQDELGERNRI